MASVAPKATLEEAKNFYIAEKVSGDEFARKKRKNRLEAHMRTVKAALGEVPALTDWTTDDAYKVRDYLLAKPTLKPSSVRRELNDLKGIFSFYKAKKLKSMENPFAGIELPENTVSEKEAREPLPPDVLTKTRELILLKANPDLKLMWRLLEGTGCRVAEIAGLRLQDVILAGDNPYLKIIVHETRRIKTKSSRRDVPLVGDALTAATEAVKVAGKGPAVFARYSGPGGPNSASQALMKWVRKISSDPLHVVHSLRHNLADRCDLAGVNPIDKNAILGHMNAGTSEKHYGSEAARRVVLARAMRKAFDISET
jgi:integrase